MTDLNHFPDPPSGKTGWPWTYQASLDAGRESTDAWPTISVVTPSFNQGEYLEACIRSVLLQGYPKLEYLVIDGGSTDESVAILRKYAPWLTYWVSEPDRGQTHAINKGFDRARGDVVNWLCGDDLLLPGALDAVGRAFAASPATDVVLGATRHECIFDPSHNRVTKTPSLGEIGLIPVFNPVWQPSCFYRLRLLDRQPPLDESLEYVMDFELWANFVARKARWQTVDSCLSRILWTGDNKCLRGADAMLREIDAVYCRYVKERVPLCFWHYKLRRPLEKLWMRSKGTPWAPLRYLLLAPELVYVLILGPFYGYRRTVLYEFRGLYELSSGKNAGEECGQDSNGAKQRRRTLVSHLAAAVIRWAQRAPFLTRLIPRSVRQRVGSALFGRAHENRPLALLQGNQPVSGEPGVNLLGMLEVPNGKGEEARSAARAMGVAGVPYVPIPYDDLYLFWGKPVEHPQELPYAANVCSVNADSVGPFLAAFGARRFAGRYNIAYWTWELEEFPESWGRLATYFHEIWGLSTFIREAIAARTSRPVVCIPPAIDMAGVEPGDRGRFGIDRGRFAMLVMFDMASYPERKNPEGAIEAFRLATEGRNDGVLVVKVSRPELRKRYVRSLRRRLAGIPHVLIEYPLERQETLRLIAACDAVLSLHRSEGLGLVLAEAMALGKPVIATGYSGNLDFMNDVNSLLVRYTPTRIERTIGPYPAGSIWAEPDVEHAASLVRTLLERPETGARLGRHAEKAIRELYSSEVAGARIRERLELAGVIRREEERTSSDERGND